MDFPAGIPAKIRQFVSFWIGDYLMGIDILKIQEVNTLLNITPVQHAPCFVRGLINLRGQTVLVFDLGVILGIGPSPLTDQSHNIILKADEVGLLVDGIGEVVTVDEPRIEPIPANLDPATGYYVENVVKLADKLMMVISTQKVLMGSTPSHDGCLND